MVKTSEEIFSELLQELRRCQSSMRAVRYTVIGHPYGTSQQLRGEVLERFSSMASMKGPFAHLSDSGASFIKLVVRCDEMWIDLCGSDLYESGVGSVEVRRASSECDARMVPTEVVGMSSGILIVRGPLGGFGYRSIACELTLKTDGEIILEESELHR